MSDFVISIDRAVKTYEDYTLGPLSIHIEPGVITALIGPNGSGKTTLLHMLMNVVRPDSGTVRLFGELYGEREVQLKRRIGYVAENAYAEQVGWRIQEMAAFYAHWYPAWDDGKWRELCERFELNPKAKVSVLSKGMKCRLMFALAIAQQPELLIMDEPSSGLDPYAWRMMLEEIQRFMDGGEHSVLIATHMIEEVRRLADYVAILYDGRLIEHEGKDSLLDEWRALWVENADPILETGALPGVVHIEKGPLTRVVTQSASLTEHALQEAGIAVVRRRQIELDEMMQFLIMKENEQSRKGAAIR